MLSRQNFRRAIHEGVTAARAAGMPPADAVKLYAVGRMAQCVHDNFTGCPLTLAGLYKHGDYIFNVPAKRHLAEFVDAYDSAMHNPETRWCGWTTIID